MLVIPREWGWNTHVVVIAGLLIYPRPTYPSCSVPGIAQALHWRASPVQQSHEKAQTEAEGCWRMCWGIISQVQRSWAMFLVPIGTTGAKAAATLQGWVVPAPCLRSIKRLPAKSASTLWIQAFSFSYSATPTRSQGESGGEGSQVSSHRCEEIKIQVTVNQEDIGQRERRCHLRQESYPKRWVKCKVGRWGLHSSCPRESGREFLVGVLQDTATPPYPQSLLQRPEPQAVLSVVSSFSSHE